MHLPVLGFFLLVFSSLSSLIFSQKKEPELTDLQKQELFYEQILNNIKQYMSADGLEALKKNNLPTRPLGNFKGHNLYQAALQIASYKFPVTLYQKEKKITKLHFLLPSALSHDRLHEQLIASYGKQKEYQLKNEHARYEWAIEKDGESAQLIYESTCTITCFPIYLSYSKQ